MSKEALSPSSPTRERDLWRSFAEARDIGARDELVTLYLPVAQRMARRYAGISEPYDDLFQVASLGLVKAVERFDPARGTPFLGFAKPTILGELKRHFRDKVWTVRVPRSLHDLMAKVEKAAEELSRKLQRPPSVGELSRHLGVDPADVLEALEARLNRSPLSLDTPPDAPDGDETGSPRWVGEEERGYKLVEDRLLLDAALPSLDQRERVMLKLRFVDELPQSQIAEQLGCSQMHVSRTLRRMLGRLRDAGEGVGDGREAVEVTSPRNRVPVAMEAQARS